MINFMIFGLNFSVSVGFVGVVALMHYIDNTGLMLPTFGAILCHEAGHIIMMRIFKCPPKKITLKVGAAAIDAKFESGTKQELLIALAGPTANFILFGFCLLLYNFWNNENLLINSLTMLIVGTFNLLPIRGLDGGTVLSCFFLKVCRERTVAKIIKWASVITCIVILSLGIVVFYRGENNPSLILLALYLIFGTLLKI